MAKINIGIPQGTRDFGPDVVRKRNYIIDTIRNVFELYGFEPLETPAMENIDTLMGKYGEEGDKLLFRILNSGPVLEQLRRDTMHGVSTMNPTEIGKIAETEWFKSSELRPDMNLELGEFIVMPNHIHGIICIGENEYNRDERRGRRDAMHGVSTNNSHTPPYLSESYTPCYN